MADNHHSDDDESTGLTRRQTLAGLTAMAGAGALAGLAGAATDAEARGEGKQKSAGARLPVVYVPHGGGPWPWMKMPFGDPAELAELAAYLRSLPSLARGSLKALLVISAHWEEAVPTVMTSQRPPMLYDYYGFPPDTYTITWPAPGAPALAARVRQHLEKAGFATGADPARGFDHGTFVPLKLAWPAADVPVVQLSLKQGLDPAEHLAMGRALAPLRDEGVLIIGSGMSFHNLREIGPRGVPSSQQFDAWLNEAIALEPRERDLRLTRWESAPAARRCHPREEHLLPLMVIAGAAGTDRGRTAYSGTLVGVRVSAHQFG